MQTNIQTDQRLAGFSASGCSVVVFRVQDKDGRGPWKPGFSQRWVEDRPEEEYAALVPWPLQFGDVMRRRIVGMSLGCGCRTLEQLRRWFTPIEYATLRRFGYCAVKMEVGRILGESDIQCVFERAKPLHEDIEPVELYPPNEKAHRSAPGGKVEPKGNDGKTN